MRGPLKRRQNRDRIPEKRDRFDRWVLGLTVGLAYLFMAAMAASILFPNLDVGEGWMIVLLLAVEVFFLLRAYIAFRVRSSIEGASFVVIFLIVLIAWTWG